MSNIHRYAISAAIDSVPEPVAYDFTNILEETLAEMLENYQEGGADQLDPVINALMLSMLVGRISRALLEVMSRESHELAIYRSRLLEIASIALIGIHTLDKERETTDAVSEDATEGMGQSDT